MTETKAPWFQLGDWVFNTANSSRSRNFGIIVKLTNEYCDVFWMDTKTLATIKRDGSVNYTHLEGREADRIVLVNIKLVKQHEGAAA